jgi:hypothetical protein
MTPAVRELAGVRLPPSHILITIRRRSVGRGTRGLLVASGMPERSSIAPDRRWACRTVRIADPCVQYNVCAVLP